MIAPENPFRPALASMYMENHMGKPEDDLIKKAVNGNLSDLSLDYYIGTERMINNAIMVFKDMDQNELHGAGLMFSMMTKYVSYEIERLSTFKNED